MLPKKRNLVKLTKIILHSTGLSLEIWFDFANCNTRLIAEKNNGCNGFQDEKEDFKKL